MQPLWLVVLLPTSACTSPVTRAGGEGGARADGAAQTTTAASSSIGPETAGGGDAWPSCLPPDSSAVVEHDFDLGKWEQASTEAGKSFTLEASCVVGSTERAENVTALHLECDDTVRGRLPITASFTLPPDLELRAPDSTRLDLRYESHGTLTDVPGGERFAMFVDGALWMAAYDEHWDTWLPQWSALLDPVRAALDSTPCPRICDTPDGACPPNAVGYAQRHAIALTEGDLTMSVLDGGRGRLSAPSGTFELVVAAARVDARSASPTAEYRLLLLRREGP